MSNLARPKVRRLVPARVELAPGLARAPKVQPLLDAAYSIAAGELKHLQAASLGGVVKLDGDDFKRFAVIMERLPAMLREERGGDRDAADALRSLPEGELRKLAAQYLAEEQRTEDSDGQAIEADGEGVEGGQDAGDDEEPVQ